MEKSKNFDTLIHYLGIFRKTLKPYTQRSVDITYTKTCPTTKKQSLWAVDAQRLVQQ